MNINIFFKLDVATLNVYTYICILIKFKTMKKILFTSLSIALSAVLFASTGGGKTYKVDNKISNLEWHGKKVSGAHHGNIVVKEGELVVTDKMLSSGTIHFDMNSIVCNDLEGEYKGKLEGHLKSADFFDVEEHKTSTLKINSVTKAEGENNYTIKGDLTIKGITHPISFPATILMENNKLVAVGEVDVDRTKYNIKYGSGQFFEGLGDKMIYDDFTIKFKLGAKG